jgi:hypothetical protein
MAEASPSSTTSFLLNSEKEFVGEAVLPLSRFMKRDVNFCRVCHGTLRPEPGAPPIGAPPHRGYLAGSPTAGAISHCLVQIEDPMIMRTFNWASRIIPSQSGTGGTSEKRVKIYLSENDAIALASGRVTENSASCRSRRSCRGSYSRCEGPSPLHSAKIKTSATRRDWTYRAYMADAARS